MIIGHKTIREVGGGGVRAFIGQLYMDIGISKQVDNCDETLMSPLSLWHKKSPLLHLITVPTWEIRGGEIKV